MAEMSEGAVQVAGFQMLRAGDPMVCNQWMIELIPAGQVLVRVAGCGVCHTDLSYFYDGVRTRHALPLVLGHEIAGIVVRVGQGAEEWLGKSVVVPAVIPCGTCEVCRAGRGSICPAQIFPGNDVNGGFASHVMVPARGLCPVDMTALSKSGLELCELSVLADAVTTPYQAAVRAKLGPGDVAIFVGAGGVGSFGVQIAAAMGAYVIALDIDDTRLNRSHAHGASKILNTSQMDIKQIRSAVRAFVKENGLRENRWKIFETSGHPAGQSTAFQLLTHGSILSVVGYTPEAISVRLSNLMAFDAVAQGTWGCLPELYPEALSMVLDGRIQIRPFIEQRSMNRLQETFEDLHHKRLSRRPVMLPDFA